MKTTEQQHNERKREMMEKCFECYAENGLTGTGIKALADACGCTKANLYSYFKNLDELIIESTAYCMEKVEDDFMEMAPTDPKDVVRFVKEVPYWTAKKHGKKYRLMYQIYTHPKYIEHGKKFFEGVNERYTEYAKAAGAEDRHSLYGHHAADLYLRPCLRTLRHVRGRILSSNPDGGLKAGSCPVCR